MKKYEQLSIWFRFTNALLRIVCPRKAMQRVWRRIYAEEAIAVLNRYVEMNFESEEQYNERKKLALKSYPIQRT